MSIRVALIKTGKIVSVGKDAEKLRTLVRGR